MKTFSIKITYSILYASGMFDKIIYSNSLIILFSIYLQNLCALSSIL